jgi:uncharacterized protein (TIGR02453 family)
MTGFPPDTLGFLADLGRHNDRAWFEANRDRYQAGYVVPATAFVEAVGPGLQELVPGIRAEPRILGSIFRINRDTRFSQDKRPYKDHLDFWFWEGDRKAAVSGLFLRIAPGGVIVGAGAHGFARDQLARYRAAVAAEASGAVLADLIESLEAAGYEVGDETYKRTPAGFPAVGEREHLLRHSALHAAAALPAEVATSDDLVPRLLDRWRDLAPVHRWLVAHVG